MLDGSPCSFSLGRTHHSCYGASCLAKMNMVTRRAYQSDLTFTPCSAPKEEKVRSSNSWFGPNDELLDLTFSSFGSPADLLNHLPVIA